MTDKFGSFINQYKAHNRHNSNGILQYYVGIKILVNKNLI